MATVACCGGRGQVVPLVAHLGQPDVRHAGRSVATRCSRPPRARAGRCAAPHPAAPGPAGPPRGRRPRGAPGPAVPTRPVRRRGRPARVPRGPAARRSSPRTPRGSGRPRRAVRRARSAAGGRPRANRRSRSASPRRRARSARAIAMAAGTLAKRLWLRSIEARYGSSAAWSNACSAIVSSGSTSSSRPAITVTLACPRASTGRRWITSDGSAASQETTVATSARRRICSSRCPSTSWAAQVASPATSACRMASAGSSCRSYQLAAARCSSGTRAGYSRCRLARSRSANRLW